MKLNDYIEKLQELQKAGHGNLELVYAIDDEGNGFKEVVFTPLAGLIDKFGDFTEKGKEKTHICIN